MTQTVEIDDLKVGDEVRFTPGDRARTWWRVTARDEEHVVAVRQAPFQPKGVLQYTVTGVWLYQYNGQGPGLVRSSLNTMGGGWDLKDVEAGSAEILRALNAGENELSTRRAINVTTIERRTA